MHLTYDRTFALDGIEILRSGDGRTVEAYAAVFDDPVEVRDQHGHYSEEINRAAFNRTLSHGIDRIGVFYNHGVNPLTGKPDAALSVPIARAVDVRVDGRGLRTVSRYNRGPVADQVLESIRNQEIRGQSFRGRIIRSSPNGRIPRPGPGGKLPRVVRHELGLSEYGPTPAPIYAGAEILAVRSIANLAGELAALHPEARADLVRALTATTPNRDQRLGDDPDAVPATPDRSGSGAEDPPAESGHSGRLAIARARVRLATLHLGASTNAQGS
ncbi:HK97 family phage prohead protease [Actinoplanes sp. NPDC049668]|uniref:HK97 family phage prohead protease n=1 Tax=unclassified Actinoplanes TaxID=2626549 RepID=UPI0033B72C0D